MLCIIHKINNQTPEHFPFHLSKESVETRSPDHYQLKAKGPQQPDWHWRPHTFPLHSHRVDLWDKKCPTIISQGRQHSSHGASWSLEFSWSKRLKEGLMSRWWKNMERSGFPPLQTDLKALRKEKFLQPLILWHMSSSARRKLPPGLLLMLRWAKEILPLESCSIST